jgi:hypothetical protein
MGGRGARDRSMARELISVLSDENDRVGRCDHAAKRRHGEPLLPACGPHARRLEEPLVRLHDPSAAGSTGCHMKEHHEYLSAMIASTSVARGSLLGSLGLPDPT